MKLHSSVVMPLLVVLGICCSRLGDGYTNLAPVPAMVFTVTFNESSWADQWRDNNTITVDYGTVAPTPVPNTPSPPTNAAGSTSGSGGNFADSSSSDAGATPVPPTVAPTPVPTTSLGRIITFSFNQNVHENATNGNETFNVNFESEGQPHSYIQRYLRETWLLKNWLAHGKDQDTSPLYLEFGMESVSYSFPQKPDPTMVPVPVPAVELPQSFDPGSLRFTVIFRWAYHYTDPVSAGGDGQLRIVHDMSALGPNMTGVRNDIALQTGITDPDEYKRIRFLTADTNAPQNRFVQVVWGSAPALYTHFEVDGPSEGKQGPSIAQVYNRIFYLQDVDKEELVNSLEGAIWMGWEKKSDILTFKEFAKAGNDEYFASKIVFFVILMVILAVFGGYFCFAYCRAKSAGNVY